MIPYHEHINPRIMKNYSRFVTTLAILFTLTIGLKAQCSLECNDVVINISAQGEYIINISDLIQIDEISCPNETLTFEIVGTQNPQTVTTSTSFPVNLTPGTYAYTLSIPATGESCQGTFLITEDIPCVDTLFLDIGDAVGIDQVEIPITALNAMQIASMQYTFVYDGNILAFNEVIPGAIDDIDAAGNFFEIEPGRLNFSWFDNAGGTDPAIFNNNTVIYTLVFDVLLNGNTSITIDPNEPSIQQEVLNENLEEVCLNYGAGNITVNGALITGSIQNNDLLDCSGNNNAGKSDWIVEIFNTDNQYFVNTNAIGDYTKVVLPGDYTVRAYPYNGLWDFCENDLTVNVPSIGSEATADFTTNAVEYCPAMAVNVSTPFVRRCFENTYTITVCNNGTLSAEDAYVEVELQENLAFINSGWNDYTINGQIITFNIGDVAINECVNIQFLALASCDAELGDSHCVYAQVFPQSRCGQAIPNYEGPIIEVGGICDGDSLRFTISNTGIEDMLFSSEFIVVEDDVMTQEQPFILDALTSTDVVLPANGSTYRVTALQDMGFPLWSEASFGIEGCGTDMSGMSTVGFINDFASGDYSSFIDIDCQENIGSYDPNDKTVYPEGYGDENYIKNNQSLDYKIRFQNTGTDTAFLVVVVDTISEHLDLSTLQRTASSHPHTMTIQDRAITFRFDNILLPDSTTNEVASHGFVNFKINMMPDLADDILIENNADIYFDFNDPIRTNTETLRIGSDFIDENLSNINDDVYLLDLELTPNPARTNTTLEFKGLENYTDISMGVFDVTGKQVIVGKLVDFKFDLSRTSIKPGAYYIRIMSSDAALLYGGKLIVQ